MDTTLVNDAARALHLMGLAVGFGLALFADASAARLMIRPLDRREICALHSLHRTVTGALILFWASGLVLLWLRTGFQPENFSAKLMTKLGVVTLLTTNAILIGRLALPVIDATQGYRFGALPQGLRIKMACLGALSTAGWFSALALGVFSQLKTMEWSHLSEIIGLIYLAAISGAFLVALVSPVVDDLMDRQIGKNWQPVARS